MMRILLIIAICGTFYLQAKCQNDTISLPEIKVIETVSFFNVPGQAKQVITPIEGLQIESSNLSELLNMQSNINVRNYGSSGIATISIRGSGPSHTGIIWNGFDIQDIQNGQFDYTAIQLSSADKITVIYGGTGAQIGSGSIGGTILIDNEISFGNLLKADVQTLFGSFKHYGQYALFQKYGEKFSCKVGFSNNQAKNNFTYVNTTRFNHPTDTVKNGAVSQQSMTGSAKIKTGNKGALNIHLWGNKQHTEDPGTMVIPPKGYYTDNQSWRSGAHWEFTQNRMNIDIRSGYFYGKMNYFGDVESEHITHSQINEASIAGYFHKWKYKIASNYTLEWLKSTDLINNPDRHKVSVFALLQRPWKWGEAVFIARQEFIDKQHIPFTPAIGIDLFFSEKLTLSSFFSRSYRLPTFNDLYWTGWGNPDLEPEDAFNSEMSLKYKIYNSKYLTSTRLGIFYNDIYKMIVWLPVGTIWRPENYDKVNSYGVEFENMNRVSITSNIKLHFDITYTWVKSINNGKQLVYVPQHKASILLAFNYKGLNIGYNHQITSDRFANKENTITVDAYHVANLRAGKIFTYKSFEANISIGINNLYNNNYQVVRFYPTPPRNFDFTISLNFLKE